MVDEGVWFSRKSFLNFSY